MNFRLVFHQLGLLFVVLSLILLLMAGGFLGLERFWVHEIDRHARNALLLSGSMGLAVGGAMWLLLRGQTKSTHFGRREALLLTATSWMLGAVFAALPFYFWAQISPAAHDHPFRSFLNCYFEAMSGLTTTGATVVAQIESIPRSLLLWRATTQWLGGIGIVVLFVAVLPSVGVAGRRLFRSETSGPSKEGVHPHIRDTARTLWYIYLGMTALLVALLRVTGMTWFDATCHAFTTVATGGFSTRTASIGAFPSLLQQTIIIVFMVAAGVNFGLYYAAIRGRFNSIWRDSEFRLYIALLVLGSIVVVTSLTHSAAPITLTTNEQLPSNFANSLQHGAFNTMSLMTTTGYATADWNGWPLAARAALILLMFVCGSAGSTAGGIKVVRLWLVLKILHREIERVFRPQVVRPVRLGQTVVDPEMKLAAVAYVLGFVVLFAIGAAAIMLIEQGNPIKECNFTTAATASLATLSVIGPGFGEVGATGNYGWFSAPSKVLMCMLMALGRLEVFAIIVLFTPRFWRER